MFHPRGPTLGELAWQAMSSTRRGYDLLAPKFDLTPFRTPDRVLDEVAAHVRAGPPVGRALDLCCGTGAVMSHLKPLVDEVVGLDFSPGMLEEAARRVQAAPGEATIHFRQADVLSWRLPASEPRFDLVTCFGAFGHVLPPDQPTFLSAIYEALNPGGRFVFVTAPHPSPRSRFFWMAHGFNAVMRVRNRVWKPEFIMIYLTFLMPECIERCEAAGFEVRTTPMEEPLRQGMVIAEAVRPPT